ncbi:MAG TPA: hypothetical protein VHB79_10780 [Polyangiaceae bacterium]|nr:hypothetical protein [Polyangiaceae bacterium]
MPKPEELSATKYHELRERHAAAKKEREAIEYRRAGRDHREPFSLALNQAQCAEIEALIAAEQGGAAYNRSAGDLEEIRMFLEAELTAARAVLTAPAPAEPAPLASATAEALGAYVARVLEYRADSAAHAAAVGPAHERLSLAYRLAADAQQMVWRARKAAGLYAPAHVVPPPRGGALHTTPPVSIEEIDHDLAAIAAQRFDANPNGVVSQAELRLRELRHERDEFEAKAAAEAEAARLENLPIAERRIAVERLRVAAAG